MKYVYILKHIADDNDWHKVYSTKAKAVKELKSLIKEYNSEGIKFDSTVDNNWFYNDWYSIELILYKEKVL